MSLHAQPSPPGGMSLHQSGSMMVHPQVNGAGPSQGQMTRSQILANLNESVWIQIGSLTELMGDPDGAIDAYQQALRHNQWSVAAMNAISHILRAREKFPEAMEYLRSILKLDPNNGEVWGSLGHCYLMMDNLQEAYTAYQQALYYLRDPKEPKLWYGIGILYDRYGSLEHAEEAFSQVMRMQPDFEKANEIYFRLGIIYKQQQKFQQSLEACGSSLGYGFLANVPFLQCFKYIVTDPPRPLNEEDIWFQIGHVHEQQKDYESAKNAYRRVLDRDPKHAKVLQQLGWLHHQQSNSYTSQDQAIEYLEQSVSSDNQDAQSWYLLGRCYMAQQKFPKAYEAYQQAVYRDGRNPTFWCSIGVLYYQINQYRDALDAYSRAIRLNPYISEVWYDLGTLYESCNNQTADALDAYTRAAELDPTNTHIRSRLQLLRSGHPTGPNQHNAPMPQDVHPQAYQNNLGAPAGPQWPGGAPQVAQAPQSQAAPTRITDWTRGIVDIPPTQQLPQSNPYDQRDGRLQGPRPPSPRQEAPRPYQEPSRHTPVRKQHTPSPKMNSAAPGMYPPGPQALPQMNAPDRGPAFGGARPQSLVTSAPVNGTSNAPPSNHLPPYGRPFSPPAELAPVRPLRDDHPGSPGTTYPHQPYNQAQSFSSIANGAPPPAAAQVAAEAAARERDDRPPSAMKRAREWETESGPSKKVANDEARARLDEHASWRVSPPGRMSSTTPREYQRRSSSETRRENERRANENYHPSEAAHHPHAPPQQVPPMHSIFDASKEERKEHVEPAARKVEVDEDYDNNSDEDKRALGSGGARSSPQSTMMNGQMKQETVV